LILLYQHYIQFPSPAPNQQVIINLFSNFLIF
jgi:hypothetical protein